LSFRLGRLIGAGEKDAPAVPDFPKYKLRANNRRDHPTQLIIQTPLACSKAKN